jgi:HAD superfamily hydrolase (TIGR01509 family)
MQLHIPPGDFAGYIFDLDGTLIDTMPLHYRAWDQAMRRVGLKGPLDEDLFYSLGGVPTQRVAQLIGEHYGLVLDPLKVMEEKEQLYLELIPEAKLIEPVVEFARKISATRPLAIATGGTPDIAIPALVKSGLRELFPIVVTPLDVAPGRGKPAPDMFLLAAEKMGVDPKRCLVFEDAEPGIQGAIAAGMKVVRVPSRIQTPSPKALERSA